MKLTELLRVLDNYNISTSAVDFEAAGVTCNSKKVRDNFIFVAIKGSNFDGNLFIEEAVTQGAKAVVVQANEILVPAPTLHRGGQLIKVSDTRKALADLAREFYGNPCRSLKIIGITGTNGKTTVSYLIEALLKEQGLSTAVIGTVNYRLKDKVLPSRNTTPISEELQGMFLDMVQENIEYCVMEVSSHALDQDRVRGIDFAVSVFTNLTQDHLDYHNTIENYFNAKSKLFKELNERSLAVINRDDPYGQNLAALTKAEIIDYGIKNTALVMAEDIKLNIDWTDFILKIRDEKIKIRTQLIGWHNVYNILAAVCFAVRQGLSLSLIKSAIEKFSFVPGRLQRIDTDRDFSVFVDYAHTEDALSNVISSLRRVCLGRIIVVFGCGGDRDKTKRPKMGRIVSELADYAVITNDNPRLEDPGAIINDITSGIKRDNYCIIPERKEAIKKSLTLARKGDIVLLAGKGHEDYQVLNDRVLRFDDREVARECLNSMKS